MGGSSQDSLSPYASLIPEGRTLASQREDLLRKVNWAREFGFTAAKLETCVKGPYAHNCLHEGNEAIVEMVAACRELVGPKMTLMVDVAYCWSDWKEALSVIRQLEVYNIFFIETPLSSDDLNGYARLADATSIRIAAGEWLQTRYEFADLMDRARVDVVQTDVGRVGGITEAMRVVQMALDRGKIVIPHCWKTGISVAATAHVAAASPNCPFVENLPAEVAYSRLRRELVKEELTVKNGRMDLPRLPGLGVELRSEAKIKYATSGQPAFKAAQVFQS